MDSISEPLCLTKKGIQMNDYQKNLNPELQDQIKQAARNGDVITMKTLIKKGADPFEKDWVGHFAIDYLSKANPPDMIDIVKDITRFAYGRGKDHE